jgi:hypothetical protein
MPKRPHSEFANEEFADDTLNQGKDVTTDPDGIIGQVLDAFPAVNGFQRELRTLRKYRIANGQEQQNWNPQVSRKLEYNLVAFARKLAPLINSLAELPLPEMGSERSPKSGDIEEAQHVEVSARCNILLS